MKLNELFIASNNSGKVEEISKILKDRVIKFSSALDLNVEEPEEDGKTFADNALIKAKYYSKFHPTCPVISDDSGFCVEEIDGEPGVDSAIWAVQADGSRDFEVAQQKVASKLVDSQSCSVNEIHSKAKFVTTLCLYFPDTIEYEFFEGVVYGKLSYPPKGKHGMGYDPIFIPDNYTLTFAEMTLEQKNSISHRKIAMEKLLNFLNNR